MLKKFVSSVLAVFLLCGCSSGEVATTSSKQDAKEMASTIVKNLNLEETMNEQKERVVNGLFFFDEGEIKDCALYLSSDKSADVVGVFKTDQMDDSLAKVEEYVKTMKQMTLNYTPEELFKIDNAVLVHNNDTIILIVCDQIEDAKTQAEQFIK